MSEIVRGVFTNVFVTLGGLFLLSRALPLLLGKPRWLQQILLGLMFAATAVAAMLNGFPIAPGIYGDLRVAIIAVAAMTTGPAATLICLVVTGVMRVSMGGAVAGALIGLVVCTALSLGFRMLPVRKTPWTLAAFGFFLAVVNTAVPFTSVLAGTGTVAAAVPVALAIFACSAGLYPAAIAIVTTLLRREIERIDEEAGLLARHAEMVTSTKRFTDVFDLSCVPMAWVDLTSRRFLRVNREYERFTGFKEDELSSMTIEELSAPEDQASDVATLLTLAEGQQVSIHGEKKYKAKDGSVRWGRRTLTATPGPDKFGLAIVEDVTEQRRAAEQIAFLAEHDPLTGLANRLHFGDQLGKMLQDFGSGSVGVMIVDLDDFKAVNDTRGHASGDQVLVGVAGILQNCLQPEDLVARIGGDEFAIARPRATVSEAMELAEKLLSALASDSLVMSETPKVAASVGIALASAEARSPTELLKRADIALYEAKAAGKCAARLFEPSMELGVVRREEMKADLARALAESQLELEYQPLVEISTGRITGFEALLRWNHPIKGRVRPTEFISVAEESQSILAIGDWVMRMACAEAAKWPASVRVAVNVSARQFERTLPLRVVSALSASGLNPSRLQIEITESVMMQGDEANLAILGQLRELGVSIALDDFGTGYSSLSYLQRFAFDKLKIDKSFISGSDRGSKGPAIIASIVQLGHSLGMIVTAEGIETSEQLERMLRKGADEAQGYLFSRPVPSTEIPTLLTRLGVATHRRELQESVA